jgi:hypothetical protein
MSNLNLAKCTPKKYYDPNAHKKELHKKRPDNSDEVTYFFKKFNWNNYTGIILKVNFFDISKKLFVIM